MIKKITSLVLLITALSSTVAAQNKLRGTFTQHPGSEIRLKGFDGFSETVFSTDTIAANGAFSLKIPKYTGTGVLEIKGAGSLLVLLSGEKKVQISALQIQDYQNLQINNSLENDYLATYIKQQGVRNQKLSGWKWLKPIYQSEDNFSAVLSEINKEINNLEGQEAAYLRAIPKSKYASFYLPLRKLIEDRPASISRFSERIPQHIVDFMAYDLADERLWNSGLMGGFYDGHFFMLENYRGISEEGKADMKASIDHILDKLTGYDEKLLEVSEHLFKLFEKRSLFDAAEYLSFRMLEQNSCSVEGELKRRFEQYRTMKVGSKAPEISFESKKSTILRGFKKNEKRLSDINSKYKLVVFWAGWCEHCMVEIPKLQSMYSKLKNKEVEVVAISLDRSRQAYLSSAGSHEWYSYCDFKEWGSQPVIDYFVFATPSYYLLDENNIILKKISSAAQLEAIVDQQL
ncbi:TlpA family protein disulfide reductase [Flavobacteriaceae bacterium]|nr:TlpA family protein disulfide reductase [Flavobacteriaceae bacterium]